MIYTKSPVSIERLRLLPITKSDKVPGKLWAGVKHSDLLDMLMATCSTKKWRPKEPTVYLKEHNREAAMVFGIDHPAFQEDMELWLGCINSTTLDRCPRLYVSLVDSECPIFIRDYKIGKWTHKFVSNLPQYINDTFLAFDLDLKENYVNEITKLKRRWKNEKDISALLVECTRFPVKEPILRSGSITLIDKILSATDGSSWELLKAYGEVNKKTNAVRQMVNGRRFYDLVFHS